MTVQIIGRHVRFTLIGLGWMALVTIALFLFVLALKYAVMALVFVGVVIFAWFIGWLADDSGRFWDEGYDFLPPPPTEE